MTKSERNPKSESRKQEAVEGPFFIRASDFGLRHSFVTRSRFIGVRHSSFVILSTFVILSILAIRPSCFLLAATDGNLPDEIPPLMPPHAEIPPSFWERSGQWVVLGAVVLLLVYLAYLVAIVLNRKPLIGKEGVKAVLQEEAKRPDEVSEEPQPGWSRNKASVRSMS